VVFHLTTDVSTTTRHRFGDRPPLTVAGGDRIPSGEREVRRTGSP
jgi:hypothetical protein